MIWKFIIIIIARSEWVEFISNSHTQMNVKGKEEKTKKEERIPTRGHVESILWLHTTKFLQWMDGWWCVYIGWNVCDVIFKFLLLFSCSPGSPAKLLAAFGSQLYLVHSTPFIGHDSCEPLLSNTFTLRNSIELYFIPSSRYYLTATGAILVPITHWLFYPLILAKVKLIPWFGVCYSCKCYQLIHFFTFFLAFSHSRRDEFQFPLTTDCKSSIYVFRNRKFDWLDYSNKFAVRKYEVHKRVWANFGCSTQVNVILAPNVVAPSTVYRFVISILCKIWLCFDL